MTAIPRVTSGGRPRWLVPVATVAGIVLLGGHGGGGFGGRGAKR